MKKTIFGLLLALSVSLAGCAKTPPEPTPTPAPAVEEQLAVLSEKLGSLENEIDWLSYEAGTQYAVTDLDGNGRLELVFSSMQGSGLFTYSYYYEVNEVGDGVAQWVQNTQEDMSEPDIGVYDVTVYTDDSGARHYLFDDYIRNGYAENGTTRYAVVYGGGKIEYDPIAYRYAVYNDEKQDFDTTYTDAISNAITEEAFNAIGDTVFADMSKQTAHIGWASYSEWAAAPSADALAQSYAAFSVE